MAGYTMKLKRKRQLMGCATFDLRLNRSVFHVIFTKPYANKKDSKIRYKITSEGKFGTDILIRKKNFLIGWNFELNLLPLAQKESFGLFKFGVRVENMHERLFTDI